MNNTGDLRGTITRGRNIWSINSALVEEVNSNNFNRNTGYIIVSYAVTGGNDILSIQNLRLNINRNTIIANQAGQRIELYRITPGMWVDVDFSPLITRSEPPQTNAFRVVVQRRSTVPEGPGNIEIPGPGINDTSLSLVTTDRVVRVDPGNNTITIGNPNNMNQQTRFIITNSTVIQNRNGERINIRSIQPGELIEVTHSAAQTLGIPPQSTAFQIRIL